MRDVVEKLSRSQALVLLRYTLIIAMAYLVLVEHGFSSTPRGLLLLIVAALASNVLVARLPVRVTESTAFYAGVILGDTLWITATLVFSGLFGAEFFYVYFFVLLLAGIGENIGLIAVGAAVVCIAYVFVLSATGGSASLWSSRLLIRIPFLITAAAFYGYIVDRVRRERQRAREEAETVAHLEEVQHELSEHAQQLECANEDLGREISERQRAEQALKTAKDYAESLIGSSLDMIISTDVNRNIVEFNQAAEDAFGYSKAEVVGKSIDILYGDASQSLRVQRNPSDDGRFAGEITNKRKNGESFYVYLSASVIRDANGTIVGSVGVSRDITERKRAETELKARAHQQVAVSHLGQRALAGTDLSTLIDEAVSLIAETLEVEYCKVLELLPDGTGLLLRAGVGWKEGYVGQVTVGAGTDSQAGFTLASDGPVIVEELHTETRFRGPQLLCEHAVISGLSVVIHGPNRPFGVLGAHTTRRRTFTRDDIHFLQAAANVLAEAIERKRAEEALKEARARLQYLIASNPAVIYSNEGSGEFACTFISENLESAMGYAPREMLDDPKFWINHVHPDESARVLSDLPRLITEGGGILEYRFRHRDGHYCWIQDMFKVVSDDQGGPVEVIGSWTDISERKHAEETVRLIVEGTAAVVGKDFFHSFVRHVAHAFQVRFAFISELVDEKGKRLRTLALWSGEGFGENFEYDTEGTPCENVVIDKDISFYSQGVQKLFPEDRWLKEAGVESYLGIPFFSGSGNVIGHMGVMHDKPLGEELKSRLTIFASRAGVELERKRAEEALRESEERFRNLFENAPIGFGVADADGTLLTFNNAMLEPGGYTHGDIERMGNVAGLYDDPDERAIVLATAKKQGFLHQHEVRFKRKDGSYYDALLSLTPIRIQGRLGWQAMVQDITERKRAEEELKATQLQLMQSERLESVGRLAAGVAHEVKNPLAIILQGLAYLSHNALTSDNDKVSMVLQKMDIAVNRADRVIGGLLEFSAQRAEDMRPVEVNAVLEQSLALVHHELVRTRVTVVKEFGKKLPVLMLDRHKIEQVFVNLFINAIQAMSGGGTLTVTTNAKQLTELGPDDGGRQTDSVQGEETLVVIEVEDTGSGIPENKIDRIFDPFFTTKSTGQGTGLGLTVTRKIIELHSGKIDIRNRQEGGVRVTLTFPTDTELTSAEQRETAKAKGGV